MRGSNSRHLRCKRSALPTELTTRCAPFTQAVRLVQEAPCQQFHPYSRRVNLRHIKSGVTSTKKKNTPPETCTQTGICSMV